MLKIEILYQNKRVKETIYCYNYSMGVPGFFAWLLKNYKKADIITTEIQNKVNILYIDANCLFHPQCYKTLEFYNELPLVDLEDKMIKRILDYIDYLVTLVNPSDCVFIAVDGVAPLAKMNQQRKRRYRAITDNELRNNIKKKFGKEVTTIWNNTVITPGTDFMEKLHKRIITQMNIWQNKNNVTYVYSSYHVIGEGEHKILQDIKSKVNNKMHTYTIYGLDADLIFLALASNKNNIFLLREDTFFHNNDTIKKSYDDITEKLNFVSMDKTKDCINEHIIRLINMDINYDFTKDFIILCYFIGNDFIPNVPSIEIKNDGIDFLLDQYVTTYLKLRTGIINMDIYGNFNINMTFFELYINNLAKYEEYYFKVKFPHFLERIYKRQCQLSDPYEIEIWNMDNMKMFDVENQNDPIMLGYDEPILWKFRFYEYYYGVSQYQPEHINNMCHNYVEGLIWTMKYYFQKCISFKWQYKYYHAPFISDLSVYINNIKSNPHIDINNMMFPIDKDLSVITPYVQLLSVLPESCYNLLPSKYGVLMRNENSSIIDMYPTNVKLDMLYKDSYHKCITLVPNIDIERIINAVKGIKLTEKEKENNGITEKLIIVSNHRINTGLTLNKTIFVAK